MPHGLPALFTKVRLKLPRAPRIRALPRPLRVSIRTGPVYKRLHADGADRIEKVARPDAGRPADLRHAPTAATPAAAIPVIRPGMYMVRVRRPAVRRWHRPLAGEAAQRWNTRRRVAALSRVVREPGHIRWIGRVRLVRGLLANCLFIGERLLSIHARPRVLALSNPDGVANRVPAKGWGRRRRGSFFARNRRQRIKIVKPHGGMAQE